jgi:predicted DCC family thiol-disulfide oxidoreductase YuxK
VLDLSGGDQQYDEDCPVCCRPVVFLLETDGTRWQLSVRREDD